MLNHFISSSWDLVFDVDCARLNGHNVPTMNWQLLICIPKYSRKISYGDPPRDQPYWLAERHMWPAVINSWMKYAATHTAEYVSNYGSTFMARQLPPKNAHKIIVWSVHQFQIHHPTQRNYITLVLIMSYKNRLIPIHYYSICILWYPV